ncbi:MAG: hypothetical protein A3I17_04115 [Candidatus Rokubacteria bacterium RIFCSPLOWO2_02_FULL_72_37]|nr:MAG: hypothetical protein A3I17_04115 [Candidatus Rokubacteria bacterium RIFCSPLOWO2_02_FULL_72_37]
MRPLTVRILVAGLLVLVLSGSLLELSCLAGEARARAPRTSLFTDAPEPELRITSEFDDFAGPPGATLTR